MATKRQSTTPPELAAVLRNDAAAKTAFAAMPASHRAAYCRWVAEAKKPETREKRAKESLEMMRERGVTRKPKRK